MPQEKTDMKEQDYALEKDELGQDIEMGLKDSLLKELTLHNERLEQQQKAYDNYKVQWDLENERYQILLDGDNISRVEPTIKAELNPRYNEIQRELLSFKYRQEKFLADATLKRYENELEGIRADIKATQDELDKIQGE